MEREGFPLTIDGVGPIQWLYGHHARKSGHRPAEVWGHWTRLLRSRIAERWHNVVAVTGEPGCGKSTLALRLARDLDRGFSADQVAYCASDMLALYRRLGHGQVAVYDEAILGLLSNDFQSPEARELVKAVNVVRAKGITVFLCIPDIHRLLAAWREEAVRFWVHCESDPRGLGWMHERSPSVRYERRSNLGLYKDPEWNPLRWGSLEKTAFWSDYEKLKIERIDRFMEESLGRVTREDAAARTREKQRHAIRELLRDGTPWTRIREVLHCGQAEIAEVARELRRDTTTRPGSA
jgi:DNA polymerase III delta prime subunit